MRSPAGKANKVQLISQRPCLDISRKFNKIYTHSFEQYVVEGGGSGLKPARCLLGCEGVFISDAAEPHYAQ